MKVSEHDPRSKRTRDLLRKALVELASEKNLAAITIQEITESAGVNRSTFYLHYQGLHELLEDCAHNIFSQLRSDIYANKVSPFRRDVTALTPFVESVFRHLDQHDRFYRAMLGEQGDPLVRGLFQEFLMELIFEPIAEQFLTNNPDPVLEMNMNFFNAGFIGIASWWLEKDKPISIEHAALHVTSDLLPGYLKMVEKQSI